jgi:hypothetical protein
MKSLASTYRKQTILAPELVSFRAVLGVTVGYYVSAVSASDDEDFPHSVVGEVFLVALDIHIARFEYHVTAFTVVDRVKDRPVPLVYPALSHSDSLPRDLWVVSA